ncbi:MAG: hypothetical protein WBB43_17835 [Limnoraphis sp.]
MVAIANSPRFKNDRLSKVGWVEARWRSLAIGNNPTLLGNACSRCWVSLCYQINQSPQNYYAQPNLQAIANFHFF